MRRERKREKETWREHGGSGTRQPASASMPAPPGPHGSSPSASPTLSRWRASCSSSPTSLLSACRTLPYPLNPHSRLPCKLRHCRPRSAFCRSKWSAAAQNTVARPAATPDALPARSADLQTLLGLLSIDLFLESLGLSLGLLRGPLVLLGLPAVARPAACPVRSALACPSSPLP